MTLPQVATDSGDSLELSDFDCLVRNEDPDPVTETVPHERVIHSVRDGVEKFRSIIEQVEDPVVKAKNLFRTVARILVEPHNFLQNLSLDEQKQAYQCFYIAVGEMLNQACTTAFFVTGGSPRNIVAEIRNVLAECAALLSKSDNVVDREAVSAVLSAHNFSEATGDTVHFIMDNQRDLLIESSPISPKRITGPLSLVGAQPGYVKNLTRQYLGPPLVYIDLLRALGQKVRWDEEECLRIIEDRFPQHPQDEQCVHVGTRGIIKPLFECFASLNDFSETHTFLPDHPFAQLTRRLGLLCETINTEQIDFEDIFLANIRSIPTAISERLLMNPAANPLRICELLFSIESAKVKYGSLLSFIEGIISFIEGNTFQTKEERGTALEKFTLLKGELSRGLDILNECESSSEPVQGLSNRVAELVASIEGGSSSDFSSQLAMGFEALTRTVNAEAYRQVVEHPIREPGEAPIERAMVAELGYVPNQNRAHLPAQEEGSRSVDKTPRKKSSLNWRRIALVGLGLVGAGAAAVVFYGGRNTTKNADASSDGSVAQVLVPGTSGNDPDSLPPNDAQPTQFVDSFSHPDAQPIRIRNQDHPTNWQENLRGYAEKIMYGDIEISSPDYSRGKTGAQAFMSNNHGLLINNAQRVDAANEHIDERVPDNFRIVALQTGEGFTHATLRVLCDEVREQVRNELTERGATSINDISLNRAVEGEINALRGRPALGFFINALTAPDEVNVDLYNALDKNPDGTLNLTGNIHYASVGSGYLLDVTNPKIQETLHTVSQRVKAKIGQEGYKKESHPRSKVAHWWEKAKKTVKNIFSI